jgi:hypothetical protein
VVSQGQLNVVTIPTTTTTVASSLNPSTFNQQVTFTTTVAGLFGGTPTGTVTFTYGSTTLCNAEALTGEVATCTYAILPAGLDMVTATYSGDANFSSTSGLLNQRVLAITTTTLASSATVSMSGSSVTFTATVTTSGSTVPTGTISFVDDSTTMGTGTLTSGVASYTTLSLGVGQHQMTAVYSDDTNNAGSVSAVLTQTVNAADFTLAPNPTTRTVTAGNSGTFLLTVTPQGSFTNAISFSCAGLPASAGCSFTPPMVSPDTNTATTTLNITTAAHIASVAPPAFGRFRSSNLYAIWLALPAMLLATGRMAAPKRRKLLSYCLVLLLVIGCVLQMACGGGGTGSGGGGGTGGTPAGTYSVTVTGAAGSTQHTTTVTLTVQ